LRFNFEPVENIPGSIIGIAITPISAALGVDGGDPPYGFSSTTLPAGITIDPDTGIISGIPTMRGAGATATLTVTDDAGASENTPIEYGDIHERVMSAALEITAPVPNAMPTTTATRTGDGADHYSASTITWSGIRDGAPQDLNPDGSFADGTVYTASVTLTADAANFYTFAAGGLTSATVNGSAASISGKTATTATVSFAFHVTDRVPNAPRSLEAAPGDGQVSLSWAAPASNGGTDVSGYELSYGLTDGYTPNWQPIPDSGVATLSHSVSGLTNDRDYTFQVRAVNAAGSGPGSDEASATPRKLHALTIIAGTGGRITQGASDNYVMGSIINIAASANSGYRFNGWISSDGGTFASAGSVNTSFTMPNNPVTVTARFVRAGNSGDPTPTPAPTPSPDPAPSVTPQGPLPEGEESAGPPENNDYNDDGAPTTPVTPRIRLPEGAEIAGPPENNDYNDDGAPTTPVTPRIPNAGPPESSNDDTEGIAPPADDDPAPRGFWHSWWWLILLLILLTLFFIWLIRKRRKDEEKEIEDKNGR